MTIVPPASGEPRRPEGPRDPGDAWVVAPTGERYWGRFGAAGLLAVDPQRGVLLQHRVAWSHFGGTWGLPGGALHEGEASIVGALREAQEEAGVPDGSVRPRFTSVLDLGIWSYTTVVADVQTPFDPVISDPESVALEWVAIDEVESRPLHPGFASSWPALRRLLSENAALVVDAANVVGSVPDGWWKDRAGAAERLATRLDGIDVAAREFDLDGTVWFPEIALVVEGQANGMQLHPSTVAVVRAQASGDDAIVEEVARRTRSGEKVIGVTSDRGLAARIEQTTGPGRVRSAKWLLELL